MVAACCCHDGHTRLLHNACRTLTLLLLDAMRLVDGLVAPHPNTVPLLSNAAQVLQVGDCHGMPSMVCTRASSKTPCS